MQKNGFSLVELSIVLVILGLLTGGILGGQSLMKAAELRSVGKEVETYSIAVNTFRTKYLALPGDMTNATHFWGAAPDCTDQSATGEATCDGDGNGFVNWVGGAEKERSEFFTFWQHLSNAELIEGAYDGVRGPGSYQASTVPGTNAPQSKYSGGCINFVDSNANSNRVFSPGNFNVFLYGQLNVPSAGNPDICHNVLFSTEEAWNIDTKIDDGQPGLGTIQTYNPTLGSHANCASSSDIDATYQLTETGPNCALRFKF